MKKIFESIFGEYDQYVFYPLMATLTAAVGLIVFDNKGFQAFFDTINKWLIFNFAWGFQVSALIVILFGFWLAFSRYGKLKLGKEDDQPEFSTLAWVSMMFSAGFGLGVWMWTGAEIMYHLDTSAMIANAGQTGKPGGVPMALQSVFMDWGIHGWMLFAVGGLAIAFPAYRLGKPINLAAGLYGIFKEKAYTNKWGKATDVLGAVASLGGTAAALGFGITMIGFGLSSFLGIEVGFTGKVISMIFLVAAFVASASSGIKRGIKFLSLVNIWMSAALCIFLLIVGPTNYIFTNIFEALGLYLNNFFSASLWGDAGTFVNGEWQTRGWNNWWLVFFILWWASYIPFCGGFIARISKGRTIKEYVLGSVILPTAMTFILFGIMGSIAAHIEISGAFPIYESIKNDVGSTLYVILEQYPFASITTVFVFVSTIIYGITTYDSTTYFISMQVAKGESDPKITMRILWGAVIGFFGLVSVSVGNFDAIKSLAIVCGAPFFVVLIVYMYSIVKMLKMADTGDL
ncbi:BCCT family transporter [Desulforhopalus singaporensis]|uniref:Glycine betaine transporter n=1 Tax=Desulforhopalus singaporensis TaxID=91360 RepID=A0A1H0UEY1_9BACT|nr:BCCT family transporter [Desulforhopalus singaporensis]SDP64548.1 glycine betaine transporter [Desulforhopalus singaporensis]